MEKNFKPVLLGNPETIIDRYQFNEADHPRGQPDNKGQFVEREGKAASDIAKVKPVMVRGSARWPIERIDDESALVPKFELKPNGRASVRVNPNANFGDLIRGMSRVLDSYFSPLKENEFIRVHHDPKDFEHIVAGTHQGSTNHATGEHEGGLSVAQRIEEYKPYAYIVTGEVIGQGSDAEPLLETSSVKAVSDRMDTTKLDKQLQKKRQAKIKKLGWEEGVALLQSSPEFLSTEEYRKHLESA
jgi:hypothetical protein